MKALYIVSRIIQTIGMLLLIGGVSVVLLDWFNAPLFSDIDGAVIVGVVTALFGYVAVLLSRGLDYCLRRTAWIETCTIGV